MLSMYVCVNTHSWYLLYFNMGGEHVLKRKQTFKLIRRVQREIRRLYSFLPFYSILEFYVAQAYKSIVPLCSYSSGNYIQFLLTTVQLE